MEKINIKFLFDQLLVLRHYEDQAVVMDLQFLRDHSSVITQICDQLLETRQHIPNDLFFEPDRLRA